MRALQHMMIVPQLQNPQGLQKWADDLVSVLAEISKDLAASKLPIRALRGWVRFDGTGTLSITSSYNVASVTDNGTGNYTVNWKIAFGNANYCVVAMTTDGLIAHINSITASATQIYIKDTSGTLTDSAIVCVMAVGS